MKKKNILIIVLVIVLLLGGAALLYQHFAWQGSHIATEQGDEGGLTAAPDFTVTDLDGNSVSLKDFQGKPVIVNFWATWCHYCAEEMPHFEDVYQQYGEQIHILMINVQESHDTAKVFIENGHYTFPVYLDGSGSAAGAYGATGLPATFFIDADGNAVAQARGVLNREDLQQGIDLLIK